MVLNFFLRSVTFCVQCLLGGHHPPQRTSAYVQITSDCGWQTPALRQHCQVCELRTADQVAFYTWQSLLHTTALLIDGLHLEMGLPVDSVHGEICAESL